MGCIYRTTYSYTTFSPLQNCNDIAPWVAAESHDEVPDELLLMDRLRGDLPGNNYYMGGVGNGLGLCDDHSKYNFQRLAKHSSEQEHIHALCELDFDVPDIAEDDDNVDAGPSLWVGNIMGMGNPCGY